MNGIVLSYRQKFCPWLNKPKCFKTFTETRILKFALRCMEMFRNFIAHRIYEDIYGNVISGRLRQIEMFDEYACCYHKERLLDNTDPVALQLPYKIQFNIIRKTPPEETN